jgi:DNA-binding response OmpR family regulator
MERVLFVEDDEALRLTQSLHLQREDVDVVTARPRRDFQCPADFPL